MNFEDGDFWTVSVDNQPQTLMLWQTLSRVSLHSGLRTRVVWKASKSIRSLFARAAKAASYSMLL